MRKKLDTGLLHAMQAFLRVVDSGSFSAAGHQMGLTTAQISRLVSDLEERLGIKLLQRTTRQRALTEAGQAYAERCREVIALVQDAEADASGATIRPRGRLRVQCMASFGQHYVAPALAGFCASHPELVVEYSASQYEPDLLARGADVSLYLAETLQNSGTVARRIGTTFAVLCASPAYLALHGEPGNPEQLHGYDCIRLVNPSITTEWRLTTGDGRVTPLEPKGQVIADTPELLVEVAMRGGGLALLPLFSVIDQIRAGQLKRVLPQWRSPDIGVYALYPTRHFMDAKTRAWLEWVDAVVAPRVQADAAYFL
ncbi:LysR family transcriptional regulator [Comamonas endophytica]|uniref:LysR family transcriptional regulator n=1 Tax=Comamonas endophytica TaxID=2949090 RepID=A0ABY6GHS7_9BURK|nr:MULTISPECIES: LysR family transcriptional regulator [unclassified Acidovorax]MCD2513355.1 LysR family transcriptional regulator [Acidovorax sp. D4N7]UYG53860.1 LysR family transcriptional regulator [Acidovorax sp. 5MLIR]